MTDFPIMESLKSNENVLRKTNFEAVKRGGWMTKKKSGSC